MSVEPELLLIKQLLNHSIIIARFFEIFLIKLIKWVMLMSLINYYWLIFFRLFLFLLYLFFRQTRLCFESTLGWSRTS